jgi:hypothetical protein
LALLARFDEELERKIVLVAAGGTALTLLNAKPSTLDLDFTGPSEDIAMFDRAEKAIPHGFKIDKYKDGAVFTQILPDITRQLRARRSRDITHRVNRTDFSTFHSNFQE